MTRERPLVRPGSRPRFPRYVRIKYDPVRKATAVLAPERVYWPDAVAVDILNLCDGDRTIETIADQLARDYAAPLETITADVLEFVQSWTDKRLLTLSPR